MVFLFLMSLVCLMLGSTTHFLTYINIDLLRHLPWLKILHILVIIIGMIIFIVEKSEKSTIQGLSKELKKIYKKEYVSAWLGIIRLLLIFIYIPANFFICLELLEGGSPSIENGVFILKNHGTIIRVLTEAEYLRMLSYISRLFTGHWIAFFFTYTVYFLNKYRRNNTIAKNNFQSSRAL